MLVCCFPYAPSLGGHLAVFWKADKRQCNYFTGLRLPLRIRLINSTSSFITLPYTARGHEHLHWLDRLVTVATHTHQWRNPLPCFFFSFPTTFIPLPLFPLPCFFSSIPFFQPQHHHHCVHTWIQSGSLVAGGGMREDRRDLWGKKIWGVWNWRWLKRLWKKCGKEYNYTIAHLKSSQIL